MNPTGAALPKLTIDPSAVYVEASEALRHYSAASMTVRITTVIQGITLLGFWTLALSQNAHIIMGLLPPLGLLFTLLLFRFHLAYFRATEFYYDALTKMEQLCCDDPAFRPFSGYNKRHSELYSGFVAKFFVLNAPFTLVGSAFVLATIVSIILLRS